MDKLDVTDAKTAENPRKIGKFIIGLLVGFIVAMIIVALSFLHYAPIAQR